MLAAALIATLVVAACNWYTRVRPNPTLENITKPLTTVLVMWIAVAADGPRTATILAIVGLGFCLIGDIALLDPIDKFQIGLAAFLVGHLVFIAMFVALGLDRPWWGVVAAVVVIAHASLLGPTIIRGAARTDPGLRVPVIAYLLVISAMAVVAASTGRWWAVFGAFAFVASDTVLAWRAFVDEKKWMAVVVMITYHAALIGLALSLH